MFKDIINFFKDFSNSSKPIPAFNRSQHDQGMEIMRQQGILREDPQVLGTQAPTQSIPQQKQVPQNFQDIKHTGGTYQPKYSINDVPRDVNTLNDIIVAGLAKRNNPPISKASKDFADFGATVPPKVNPLLPVATSIMETGGGQWLPEGSVNPYNTLNIKSPDRGGWAQFNDYRSSLFGNSPDETVNMKGMIGEDFSNTGDVSTFFKRYTPEQDPLNPRNGELVDRYNMIMDSLLDAYYKKYGINP